MTFKFNSNFGRRIANLLGVFPEIVLCDIYFSGFFDDAFDLHISSIVHFLVDCVAKLVLFISVTEADDSPAPTLRRSSLISPLLSLSIYLLYWGTVFLILVYQMVAGFYSSSILPSSLNL